MDWTDIHGFQCSKITLMFDSSTTMRYSKIFDYLHLSPSVIISSKFYFV